ncbi:efflux RND transporter periplasmic adaptor subunit [Urbifossiella limnaea]|uniref:Dihydrolipoamide acetyltransferase n=1 Tax=Urbifossiella limnaea TaxID=2528023 RepID=A0A517XV28_9BACT|nr:efflux RND transporter periplasmic adaptor subunit [Urbifossiella limnaea]QDU21347.1 dihydrolipoamide acetyltransferase [Urbifossiella limnaea]
MRLRRVVAPVVTLVVLVAAGYAAFRTQDQWVPHVFPAKAAKGAGDGHGGGDDHAGHADHGARTDRVTLSEQAQKNLGLDVDQLTPQEYWRTMLVPGVVVDRPGESDRSVTSKVAGVVTAINARPGDTVKAGQPLFTIQLASEFLQSAQTDLVKTAKELEYAGIERDRVANLVKKGTTAEAELLKQQNVVDRLVAQLNGTRRQLQVFGLTPAQVTKVEKGEVITEVTVPAPGTAPAPPAKTEPPAPAKPEGSPEPPLLYEVQELKVALGEQVQAGQALCLLANHQRLFVEGRAFRSEADALAAAAEKKTPVKAEFADETPGAWPAQGPLTIHHLANQVDPATRTFGFYLPLENVPRTFERDGKTHFAWRYRPGQRVRLYLPVEKLVTLDPDGKTERLPFVLPAGAVAREGGEAFVFVQSGDTFRRKPVRVLYADRSDVVVANDGSVTEVEYVVRNQAAALNRAVKAQSAGGGGDPHAGHSHD